jgi:LysM repeat protein
MLFKKTKPVRQRANHRLVSRKRLHARAASGRDEVEEYESESEPSMKLSQAFVVVLILHVVAVGGIYGFNKLKETSAKPDAKKVAAAPAALVEKTPELLGESKVQKPAAKPVEVAGHSYTVVAGDTLKKIASKFNTSIEALEKANNLTSTSIIRTGQVLLVGKSSAASLATNPAKTESLPVAKSTPSVVAKPEPVQAIATKGAPVEIKEVVQEAPTTVVGAYVVAKGDNPYSIAKKFKVTQEALMKANNIDDPRKLKIGQKLVIP